MSKTLVKLENLQKLWQVKIRIEVIMDAQKRATKKWNKNNREHRNYLSKRSSARGFIRNNATVDDLNELEERIKEKKAEETNK